MESEHRPRIAVSGKGRLEQRPAGSGEPETLPQILTEGLVLDQLDRLAS